MIFFFYLNFHVGTCKVPCCNVDELLLVFSVSEATSFTDSSLWCFDGCVIVLSFPFCLKKIEVVDWFFLTSSVLMLYIM